MTKYSWIISKILTYFIMFVLTFLLSILLSLCIRLILMLFTHEWLSITIEDYFITFVLSASGIAIAFLINEHRGLFSKNRNKDVFREDLSIVYTCYDGKEIKITINEEFGRKYVVSINDKYTLDSYAKSIEGALHETIQRINIESDLCNIK